MLKTQTTAKQHPVHLYLYLSDQGGVFTDRGRDGKTIPGGELNPKNTETLPSGYRFVTCVTVGIRSRFYVHRLVLETFVGPCPNDMEARHVLSNERGDNRLCNLAWGTRMQNQADRKFHGTHRCGSDLWMAKITDDDVREMRRLRIAGISISEIAAEFELVTTHVSKVIHGKMWKHVTSDSDTASALAAIKGRRVFGRRPHPVPIATSPASTRSADFE